MKLSRREKIIALTVAIALLVIIGLVVGLVVGLAVTESSSEGGTNSTSTSRPSTTTSPPYDGFDSVYKRYRFAAVTTDTDICSQIGVLEMISYFSLSHKCVLATER